MSKMAPDKQRGEGPAHEPVELRTGQTVLRAVLDSFRINLEALMAADPIAAVELRELARNPSHSMWAGTPQTCERHGMGRAIVDRVELHDVTKNLLLASLEGEDLEMRIVDPIKRSS